MKVRKLQSKFKCNKCQLLAQPFLHQFIKFGCPACSKIITFIFEDTKLVHFLSAIQRRVFFGHPVCQNWRALSCSVGGVWSQLPGAAALLAPGSRLGEEHGRPAPGQQGEHVTGPAPGRGEDTSSQTCQRCLTILTILREGNTFSFLVQSTYFEDNIKQGTASPNLSFKS